LAVAEANGETDAETRETGVERGRWRETADFKRRKRASVESR